MDVGWSECDGVYNVSEMEIGMNEVQPFDYDKQEFPVLRYTDVQKNVLKETFPGTGEVKGMETLNHMHAGKVQEEEGADLNPGGKPVYPRYVDSSLRILNDYVKANLNDPPETQVSIKLGSHPSQRKIMNKGSKKRFWKREEVEINHIRQRDRQTVDKDKQTNKRTDKRQSDRKHLFWAGFSSFTDSPHLNEISKCQEAICDWMSEGGEEGEEEEIRKLEEDEEKEEEVLMEIAKKGAPRPRKERRVKGRGRNEKDDWCKEGEIQREAYRLVENAKKPGEARLVEGNVSRQIWGVGQISMDGGRDLGNGEIILVDPGNLSQSLMGVNTLKRVEKALGRKISLDKYERRVKGAGGGEIELLGRTKERLRLKMVGFSNYIYFRPIISAQNLPHINLALCTMKNHQLSLHMRRETTQLEDLNSHERIELYSRDELMKCFRQIYSVEVMSYVGRLKNAAQDKLHAADLIDLNVLEARLKGEVSSGE